MYISRTGGSFADSDYKCLSNRPLIVRPANAMRNGPCWNIDLNKLPDEIPSETMELESKSWDMQEGSLIDAIRSHGYFSNLDLGFVSPSFKKKKCNFEITGFFTAVRSCSKKTMDIDGVNIPVGESVVRRHSRDNDNHEEDDSHVSKIYCRCEEGNSSVAPDTNNNTIFYMVVEKSESSMASDKNSKRKSIVWFSKFLHNTTETPDETPTIIGSKNVGEKRPMETEGAENSSEVAPTKKIGKKPKKFRSIESLYQSTERMD
ncbi:hypothetical protein ZOSMA_20G00860 [Zostera marina]|uniref:Uncharacterized protein n=1 Tax=Zostera marina TaxID=29655 RepID=A0A0K9PN23_ZOSMR|nr:hypothetical protein ZOSMA_20G00860 [Zostera marina]